MSIESTIDALLEREGFFSAPPGIPPHLHRSGMCANIVGWNEGLPLYCGRPIVTIKFRLCTKHKEGFFAQPTSSPRSTRHTANGANNSPHRLRPPTNTRGGGSLGNNPRNAAQMAKRKVRRKVTTAGKDDATGRLSLEVGEN